MTRRLILLLLLVPSLAVAAAPASSSMPEYLSIDPSTATFIDTAPLRPDITCLIEPSMVIDLGAPVEGVIQQVAVDRSDTVKKGQVVARLQSTVEEAEIDYQSAKADYGRRKTQRSQDLRRKQLISEQDLDDLRTEERLAELQLKQKEALLSLKVIQSPVSGVVVDRYKNPGDLVSREKIIRIAQIDPLYGELVLPVSMFGNFKKGDTYKISPQLSSDVMDGRVVAVDKVIDPASSTFRVRLAIANPEYKYPSGQRCTIQLDGNR